MQNPKTRQKNCHLGTIAQLCRAISLQLRHVSTIGKKNLLSSNISTCPHSMVNFGPLAAEIDPVVWGTPANFNGFRVLATLLHGTPVLGSAKVCGVEQRAPPIFGRAAITLGIGPHSTLFIVFFLTLFVYGSMRQIKLATRQLLGARKCSILYCIASYSATAIHKINNIHCLLWSPYVIVY